MFLAFVLFSTSESTYVTVILTLMNSFLLEWLDDVIAGESVGAASIVSTSYPLKLQLWKTFALMILFGVARGFVSRFSTSEDSQHTLKLYFVPITIAHYVKSYPFSCAVGEESRVGVWIFDLLLWGNRLFTLKKCFRESWKTSRVQRHSAWLR